MSMRPFSVLPLIDILLLLFLLMPAYGAESQERPPLQVLLNGLPLELAPPPYIDRGRALVPLRSLFEALGGEVIWDSATRTVFGRRGDTRLALQADVPEARLNGQPVPLDVPPRIREGRAFVPARLVAESLDASVQWDGDNQTVLITTADDQWPVSTPEEQGMDSRLLQAMKEAINAYQGHDIHSLLVVRNGHLVMEEYYHGYGPETRQQVWSVTKSILSAAAGAAWNQGFLSLDEKVLPHFPEASLENRDPRKNDITIRHLLTMTSGFKWQELDPLLLLSTYFAADVPRFLLDRPMAHDPGTTFTYDSGSPHLLSAILQKKTGKTTFAYTRDVLLNPLNITDVQWAADSRGISLGGYGLEMRPRDMAKFGQLYLQKGVWKGRPILPRQWIEESFRPQADTGAGNTGYGYLWRIGSDGTYRADGGFGQRILVDPRHDIVVVFTSSNLIYNFDYYDTLYHQYILKSLQQ